MTKDKVKVAIALKFPQLSLPYRSQSVFFYLAILALVMRFPYFFDAVIDWDESTFILLGQSILDGYLPYTELLDAKPPLLWTSFALFILLLGKTVVSIRLAGTICVILTAFITYQIGRQIWGDRIGLVSGILFIIATGLSPSGEAVMSEHIALVPLMASLNLLITRPNTLVNLFFVGVAIATASLVRLNLVYVVAAVGAAILFYPPMVLNKSARYIIYRGLTYFSGVITVIFLTFIPYLIVGQENIWWLGVVETSLRYSDSQNSLLTPFLQQIVEMIFMLFGDTSIAFIGIAMLLWVGGLFEFRQIIINWKKLDKPQQRSIFVLLVTTVSLEISIIKSGIFLEHYMIQFNAIFSLLAAVLLDRLWSSSFKDKIKKIAILILLITTAHVSLKYLKLGSELIYNHRLLYGSAYEIAEFLQRDNSNRQPVLLLDGHLAYWLTNSKPLSRAMAHPSNINKEFLLQTWFGKGNSSATELAKIMALDPKFVIGEDLRGFFRGDVQIQFDKAIAKQYSFFKKIDSTDIYKRSSE
jgi:4-amino-4-deoxy-L-arabinose transferase-like glycosyltransferase